MNHDHHVVLILLEINQYVEKDDFVNRYRLINQSWGLKEKFYLRNKRWKIITWSVNEGSINDRSNVFSNINFSNDFIKKLWCWLIFLESDRVIIRLPKVKIRF